MGSKNAISTEAFDTLLGWLDPDRDEAGRKYEVIRRGLIKIFVTRGCVDAENLSDLTIDRVASKVDKIRGSFRGDPAHYFHGVAKMICLEHFRDRRKDSLDTDPDPDLIVPQILGPEYECLEECLGHLSTEQSELILEYYTDSKSAKIERRKMMASDLGIDSNALRIRVHRIRVILEQCVKNCMGVTTQ